MYFLCGTKFKFLFNSLYIFLEKENLLKFITFPEGSCWYWIDFSIVLQSLLRFSLFLSRSSVHLKFLAFVFGLHWGRPELIFWMWVLISVILVVYFCYLCSVFLNFQFELGGVISLYRNHIGCLWWISLWWSWIFFKLCWFFSFECLFYQVLCF